MKFPENVWPLHELSSLCEKTETVDPRRTPERPFKYVDIASVSNTRFEIIEHKDLIGSEAPSRARKRIRKGDVIFATTRPYLKSIAQVSEAYDGEVCSTGFCVLHAGDRLLREWLFLCAISDEFVSQVTPKMRGANYPAVTDKDILSCVVPLPPLDEQSRIVGRIKECLSRVSEIKQLREGVRQEVGAVFPSLLSSVFDDIQERATPTTIEEVAVETRYGTSNKCHSAPVGVPILRIPNVANGGVNLDDLKYCQLTSAEEDKLLLHPGDMLVVRTNGSPDLVGRCAVVNFNEAEKFGFASYLIRIRVNQSKVNPNFLSYFLTSSHGRKAIAAIRRTAAGQYNVNSENLRAITFPLPDRKLQDELVDRMNEQREACEVMKAEQAEQAKSESHLAASILARAFAGEL